MMTIRTLILTAAALTAFNGVAFADGHEKETPPPGSEPRGFSLPEIETYSLKNGVDVTLATYGRVPKAAIRAVVDVGNLNDGETPWIADLTAEMMGEGAAGRSASDQALAAASMGGDLNIGVGLDQTFVTMDILSESAPDAVALIADVVQRPDFPETEIDRVKQNLLRNISVGATQPQRIADDAFIGSMYPNHPYADAVLPDAEKFAELTLDDVKAFHAANFGGARTHIYVVGQFDRRKVKRAIKKGFRNWDEGPPPLALAPETPDNPVINLIDRPGAVQSTIRLGKRVPAVDNTIDLEAADTILGGYFSSRITRNIREDKGYTYSPNSAISLEKNAAYWRQNADITSEATGPALTEIIKEIRRLQETLPPANELDGIKNYMNGIFVIRLASRGGMASQLAFVDLHDLGIEYLENYVGAVQGLTAQSVQNAAREHLNVDDMSLTVVGDLASVRAQLETVDAIADRLPAE
ncbi:MAG: insulinase family protein [Marinicaulis sp.]|nr:insulinase family protein [Marinicaulis sp.]